MVDGHEVILNYAGKNQLISDIQGDGNNVFHMEYRFRYKQSHQRENPCFCVIVAYTDGYQVNGKINRT